MISSNCLNCDSTLEAEDKFCFYCGQQTHQHRLNLAHLGHEILHFFTHADKGIFFLIRQLIVAPGRTVREYIAGKRKKYFSPLNFFLVAVGIYVLSLTTFQPLEQSASAQRISLDSLKKAPQTALVQQKIIRSERATSAVKFMSKYANIVNMVLTPLVALVFYLFYLRGRYNYTEHLVANLYAAGINALVFSLIISPAKALIPAGNLMQFVFILLFLLWETVYRAIIYYGLMNRRTLGSFLYPFLASVLVVIGWSTLSTGVIGYYIRNGFGF